ncbi:MAG TPA: 5'-nucleotidase, partial [Ramlibacter sp.]
YMRLQLERVDVPAAPGIASSMIRKLLRFNDDGVQRVEVVILSRNDPVSGMRIFNSGAAAELRVERGVFTQGRPPFRYLRPLNADIFLSANAQDVREALAAGFPAAHVRVDGALASALHPDELRIAFDGDAVLFSDEAERIYQSEGLDAFQLHERSKAAIPLGAGPFKPFLVALHRLQQASSTGMRIRTALVTARSAPANRRAIQTLMNWNIRVDEAMFLGGLPKGEFLREFEPDFFFDDQTGHVDSAAQHVPAGHVASGVSNPG